MNDLASYRKHSLAKQVVALTHRLNLLCGSLQKRTDDGELVKQIGMVFSSISHSIQDLFYRDQYDKFSEAISKHFKVSSDQLDEIKKDFNEMGVFTKEDYPDMPIIKKNEPLNYYRVMRELCEDVERELEEKLRKEGKR